MGLFLENLRVRIKQVMRHAPPDFGGIGEKLRMKKLICLFMVWSFVTLALFAQKASHFTVRHVKDGVEITGYNSDSEHITPMFFVKWFS
jgi:hypothetical protein